MTIASRTPEGHPNQCPVCQALVCVEPSHPAGDAPCPHCGVLLWFLPSYFADIGQDSLDVAELMMELEEEFGLTITDADSEKLRTVGDVIDYLARRQR